MGTRKMFTRSVLMAVLTSLALASQAALADHDNNNEVEDETSWRDRPTRSQSRVFLNGRWVQRQSVQTTVQSPSGVVTTTTTRTVASPPVLAASQPCETQNFGRANDHPAAFGYDHRFVGHRDDRWRDCDRPRWGRPGINVYISRPPVIIFEFGRHHHRHHGWGWGHVPRHHRHHHRDRCN